MSTQQIATSVTAMVAQRLGYQALSLSEMDTSAITVIKSGSKVEIAGALFSFTGDESINASSWTAIATGATASITLTPSGSPGSQILSANWTPDQPLWSESKQGFYTSAGSVIRFVGGCVKGGVASYRRKFVITPYQRETNPTDGVFIDYGIKRVIVLGSGVDMDAAIVFSSEARQDWDNSANVFLFSKGIAHNGKELQSTGASLATIYATIGPYIPTVGDEINLNGAYGNSSLLPIAVIVSKAVRTTVSSMTVYGIQTYDGSLSQQAMSTTLGTGTVPVSMTW